MSSSLSSEAMKRLEDPFRVLETPYKWRAVTSYYKNAVPPRDYTSNVHVVPFVGDRVVVIHTKESGWGPSGGTLLEHESIADCLARELKEELGGTATQFELFGQWDSTTTAETAYRPWLPHPNFAIALGWADVVISGSSSDDGGVEMESIQEIVILSVEQAAARLEENAKPHLAALYRIASEVRKSGKPLTSS